MKKIIIYLGILFFLSTPSTSYAAAASSQCYGTHGFGYTTYSISSDKETAKADGKDAIKIVAAMGTHMDTVPANGNRIYRIVASGTGNSSDPEHFTEGYPSVFLLTSTVAGEKTIEAQWGNRGYNISPEYPEGISWGSFMNCNLSTILGPLAIKVKFTDPNPSSTPSNGSVNKNATPVPSLPAIPSLEKLKAGESEIDLNKVSENGISADKEISFSGKTIPNGKVTLYFNSIPFEDTTTADKDGNWSYVLEAGKLEPGDHSLQIAVTDPITNKISEKSEPFKFSTTKGSETKDSSEPTQGFFAKYFAYIIAAIVLALMAILLVIIRIKKKRQGRTQI